MLFPPPNFNFRRYRKEKSSQPQRAFWSVWFASFGFHFEREKEKNSIFDVLLPSTGVTMEEKNRLERKTKSYLVYTTPYKWKRNRLPSSCRRRRFYCTFLSVLYRAVRRCEARNHLRSGILIFIRSTNYYYSVASEILLFFESLFGFFFLLSLFHFQPRINRKKRITNIRRSRWARRN